MEQLAWSDALRTGIDVIDRQHRGLVDMVNATALRLAGEAALSADEVRLLVSYLKEYAEVHFSTEEALMALCGLPPDYAEHHHHNHARFLAHVGDMIDDLSENAVPDGRQLLAFLGEWLIRHIQGEDQGLARRLREARSAGHGDFHAEAQVGGGIGSTGLTRGFADVLALGSATLHASESDVLEMIADGTSPTLVMALDASLLPGTVLHANAAAEALFGVSAGGLQACTPAQLFGEAQAQRLPVVMSEVLMHGAYEGEFDRITHDGGVKTAQARITHLVLQGRMAILLVFAPPPGRARGARHKAGEEAEEAHGAPAGRTVLSRHPLFQGLTRDELLELERAARLIRLSKGELLFHKGDTPAGAYIVISGQMSLAASNSRGAEKVVDILDPPQVFGEVEVLTRQPAALHAQSLTATVLLLIPADALLRAQAASLPFGTAVLEHLGRRVYRLTGEIEALTLHTAMERIIDHLLEHSSVNAHGIVEALLPAQKQVIASYLNISPPTLSRAFQTLTDNGLITISRRYVTIPDRERLLRFRNEGEVEQRS